MTSEHTLPFLSFFEGLMRRITKFSKWNKNFTEFRIKTKRIRGELLRQWDKIRD